MSRKETRWRKRINRASAERCRMEMNQQDFAEYAEAIRRAQVADEKAGISPSERFECGQLYQVLCRRNQSDKRVFIPELVANTSKDAEEVLVMMQHVAAARLAAKTHAGVYERPKRAK